MKRFYQWAGIFPALFIFLSFAEAAPVKGIWVVRTSITTPQKVARVVDFAYRNGYTDIFVQVRGRGDALYSSEIVPRSPLLGTQSFDPLATILAQAHQRGIRVHAWINVFLAWSARSMPSNPNHVVNLHPDWVEINGKGQSDLDRIEGNGRNGQEGVYLSPFHDGVKEHLINIVDEIVSRYDVDGIHLDYVRFHDRDYGYNRSGRKKFLIQYSVDPITLGNASGSYWYRMGEAEKEKYWERWNEARRNAVSEIVALIQHQIKAQKPDVMLTAAVKPNPNQARTRYYQDWSAWLRRGYVDAVVPMNYSKEGRDFDNNIYLIKAEGLESYNIYMGVATYNQHSTAAADKVTRAQRAGYKDIVVFSFDTYEKNPAYFDILHRAFK